MRSSRRSLGWPENAIIIIPPPLAALMRGFDDDCFCSILKKKKILFFLSLFTKVENTTFCGWCLEENVLKMIQLKQEVPTGVLHAYLSADSPHKEQPKP